MCAPNASPEEPPSPSQASSTESSSSSSTVSASTDQPSVSPSTSDNNSHYRYGDEEEDPHNIRGLFVPKHQEHLENALYEIHEKGRKETEWGFFFLPITPVIVQNVEQGCPNTRKYALRGDDAFVAYLSHANGMLRNNSVQVIRAIDHQMQQGKSLSSIMGHDDYRAVKSMELFARVGAKLGDDELVSLCKQVLELHLKPNVVAAAATADNKVNPDDPFDIEDRFVFQHRKHFPRALREIEGGQKESCWIWFLIPCAPYIVNGVQKGSPMNQKYALHGGDDAVVAYLTHRDGMLRNNYVALIGAIYKQMRRNKRTLRNLLGVLDDVKAASSMQLFGRVARERLGDEELAKLCQKVLDIHEKQVKQADKKKESLFKKHERAMTLKDEKEKKKFFGLFRLGKFSEEKNKSFRHTWHGI